MTFIASIGLRTWIWRAFAQSALIPLLLVETVLVAIYLLTNTAIRDTQVEHLRQTALADLQAAATMEARLVDEQLAKIGTLTSIYRHMTERALVVPAPALPANLALTDDGVRYSPRDEGGAAVFYPNSTPAAEHDLTKVARLSSLDPLMKEIKDHHPLVAALYFNSWDSLNHIYPWFLTPDQYPHDMRIPEYNFYYLADAKHNPQRKVVWTDVYLDPAGQGWMMSAIAPAYRGDFLEGVNGVDITVDGILQQINQLQVPWNGYAMLVSSELNIMAMPKAAESDFGLHELTRHSYAEAIRRELFKPADFNLAKRAESRELASAIAAADEGIQHVELDGKVHLVAWATIPQTDWHLLTVVAEDDVFAQTNSLAQRYARIGYLLIAGLVLFYALFFSFMWLRSRQLSQRLLDPIAGISRMLDDIGRGQLRPQRVQSSIIELDRAADRALQLGEQLESSEQRRERTQQRLELVLESATEGLWEFDLVRNRVSVNGRLLARLGLTSNYLDQAGFRDRVHPDDMPAINAALQAVQAGHRDQYQAEFRFADSDGGYHWVLSRGRVLERDPQNGQLLLLAGTLVDIEGLKRVQDELRLASQEAQAASQAKSRFMSSVTHELRTPLNAILGFAQLLRMERPAVPGERDQLDEILLASHHLNQLVGDLLDWSSLQAEKPSFKLQPLSVRELFADCAELVRAQAENQGLTLQVELPQTALRVLAEPRRLRQVLLNLLSNAIKYNSPCGTIRLHCEVQGERVRLLVDDTGLGLSAEQQAQLFEPFQRLGRENTAIQGTGIGLVLCRELASLMGGQIGVRSESGVGSCFWIELAVPATGPEQAAVPAVRRVAYAAAGLSGQPQVQAALADFAMLRVAGDAASLLQLLRDEPIDLLLLDQHLPGIEPADLLRQLRQDPHLQRLLIVLLCAPGEAGNLTLLNYQGLLSTPLDIDELRGLVGALLMPEVADAK